MNDSSTASQDKDRFALAYAWGQYRVYAKTSGKRKDELTSWRFRVLIMGIAGAVFGVLCQDAIRLGLDVHFWHRLPTLLGGLSALFLGLATYFGRELVSPEQERQFSTGSPFRNAVAAHQGIFPLAYTAARVIVKRTCSMDGVDLSGYYLDITEFRTFHFSTAIAVIAGVRLVAAEKCPFRSTPCRPLRFKTFRLDSQAFITDVGCPVRPWMCFGRHQREFHPSTSSPGKCAQGHQQEADGGMLETEIGVCFKSAFHLTSFSIRKVEYRRFQNIRHQYRYPAWQALQNLSRFRLF